MTEATKQLTEAEIDEIASRYGPNKDRDQEAMDAEVDVPRLVADLRRLKKFEPNQRGSSDALCQQLSDAEMKKIDRSGDGCLCWFDPGTGEPFAECEFHRRRSEELRRIRNEQVCPEHAGLIEKFMAATALARAQFERIRKLDEAIAAVQTRRKMGTIYAALRHAGAKPNLVLEAQNKLKLAARAEDAALEVLEAKPVPMCKIPPIRIDVPKAKPDPLEDIMPAPGEEPRV